MSISNITEKRHQQIEALREQITRETGKTPEQLYDEREKRIRDACELKKPDRIPLLILGDTSSLSGLPRSAAYYDPVPWNEAVINTTFEFEPDAGMGDFGTSGMCWEILDVKNRLWPGGPLPPDYTYQFVEGEYMKAEEYDLFLRDPSDFIIRYYLPRIYGILAPLQKLPPLNRLHHGFEGITALFTNPEFKQLATRLEKAGKALEDYRRMAGDLQQALTLLGFPPFSYFGSVGGAPFDTVSSFFRGMQGAMMDMYRQPEKLLEMCDKILELQIANTVPVDPSNKEYPKRAAIPLWRGDKVFMSETHFRKFYWPGLKKALQASIDMGYIPIPGFEAHFGERLECLRELPKGKVVAFVDHTDVLQAKKILEGHTCIVACDPQSLKLAPLKEAEAYYKKIIDKCAGDGGLIITITLPETGKREELKAFIKTIKEYATY